MRHRDRQNHQVNTVYRYWLTFKISSKEFFQGLGIWLQTLEIWDDPNDRSQIFKTCPRKIRCRRVSLQDT